ncbi:MAG: Maf family protein [Bacteriovoracaceae bacterium]
MSKYKLVLASGSPRRKELISHLGIPFIVRPSHIEEITEEFVPKQVALDLAKKKGDDVFSKLDEDNYLVVSSDTLVTLDERIYGKPKDENEAKKILLELSGKTHEVYTGVYLRDRNKSSGFVVSTKVSFASITDDLLHPYLKTKESLDKAGAYGIQGAGLTFIENIEGSYSNVVGFPLYEFIQELKRFTGEIDKWRELFI